MLFSTPITIYLKDSIKDFSLLEVTLNQPEKLEGLDVYSMEFAYSIDGENFSDYGNHDDISQEIEDLGLEDVYISVKVSKNVLQTREVSTIYKHEDTLGQVKPDLQTAEITLKYDGDEVQSYKSASLDDLVSQYPLWNLNNNQDITVKRWVAQCNSMAEMYGHYCIYFKTRPTASVHTLKHHYKREVIDVKKIPLLLHNNEIGNIDRLVYSDWDLPLQDDFMVDIVWDKFQTAFGAGYRPEEKDYIYFPMLNRMYRIGVVQPVNKFMGKVAWFEAQLLKYEDDEDVTMSKDLSDEISDIPEFQEALNFATAGELLDISGTGYIQRNEGNVLEQTGKHINDDLRTHEKIEQATDIEKRHATENYSNKLVDSTHYLSLRESDKYRQFYEKRLSIVQVKPDTELFQVSMYDNSKIENNVVALQYKVTDFTDVSKFRSNVLGSYELSFDFVFLKKFGSQIISIIDDSGSLILNSIYTERSTYPKIVFRNDINPEQNIKVLDAEIKDNNLCNFYMKYDLTNNQYIFRISELSNKKKKPIFNDILIVENQPVINIGYIHLYGGKFLSSNVCLKIDGNEIMNDVCSPLLIMNNEIR